MKSDKKLIEIPNAYENFKTHSELIDSDVQTISENDSNTLIKLKQIERMNENHFNLKSNENERQPILK